MIWSQRGDRNFSLFLGSLSRCIWGEPREIAGDTILAVTIGRQIEGLVAFHNYDPAAGTMEISAAAETPRWLNRRVLKEIFGYIFDQCDCQAAVMRCDPDDRTMSRIATAYGFQRYDIPRLRGRNKSEAIYILSEEDWRSNGFHKERQVYHRKVSTKTHAA